MKQIEYLEVLIIRDGKMDKEIRNRTNKANSVIHVPTLLYSAELWAIIDKHISKVTSSEMIHLT